ESGRFDTLQISVSVADQEAIEAVLPAARQRQLGVIAKRPVANAVWASSRRPGSYHVDYWERLRALDYDFLGRPMDEAGAVAQRGGSVGGASSMTAWSSRAASVHRRRRR